MSWADCDDDAGVFRAVVFEDGDVVPGEDGDEEGATALNVLGALLLLPPAAVLRGAMAGCVSYAM